MREEQKKDMAVDILLDEYTGLDVNQLIRDYEEAEKNGTLPQVPESLDRRVREMAAKLPDQNEGIAKLMMDLYADMDIDECIAEYDEKEAGGEIPKLSEEETARQFQAIVKKHKERKRKKLFLGSARILCAAAAIALMLVGLATVAVLSVEAWRVPVLKFVVETFDRYSIISIEEQDSSAERLSDERINTLLNHVPEEYKLVEQRLKDDQSCYLRFENSTGEIITLRTVSSRTESYLDTENADQSFIWINGYEITCVKKNGCIMTWLDEEKQIIFELYAGALDLTSLQEIVFALTN